MSADNNAEGPEDLYQRRLKRFDFLMNRYLAREASDPEQEELHSLTENGFGERFRGWLDEHERTDSGTANLSGKARQEILNNILGSTRAKTRPVTLWWGWAAAVLIALGGVAWFTVRNHDSAQVRLSQQPTSNQEDDWRVVKGKQFLNLPDGSSVLMNQGSELSYSIASFQGGSREVTLNGEAYFDIVRDPEKPFLVKTGAVVTRVLGTSFNVNMRQNKVVVTVTRGLVEVGGEHRVYARIRPDEQITVDTQTEQFNTASVSAGQEIGWKEAYLVLDNIDLEKAGKLIGDHYDVKLVFTQEEVKKCRITASFLNNEDLATVLTVLSRMIGASYEIQGNTVTIAGGSCG
nr:FecR domain-containing protein [uncultured Dyadobacter sp.]